MLFSKPNESICKKFLEFKDLIQTQRTHISQRKFLSTDRALNKRVLKVLNLQSTFLNNSSFYFTLKFNTFAKCFSIFIILKLSQLQVFMVQ